MYRVLLRICVLLSLTQYSVAHATEIEIATVHIPPYIIKHSDGSLTGIAVDLIKKTGLRCNLTTKFTVMSWARAVRMAELGEASAVMPLAKSKGRTSIFHFPITALLNFEMTIFGLQGSLPAYNGDIYALQGLTVGTLRDIFVSDLFEEAVQLNIIKRSKRDSYKSLVLSLSRNRLDAFIGDKKMGQWAIAGMSQENTIIPLTPPVSVLPVYLGFSAATISHELVNTFDSCLKAEITSGTLAALATKYENPNLQPVHGQ